MKYWIYNIEIFKEDTKEWISENRYFLGSVSLGHFNLSEVRDKRRNAKFIGITENPPWETISSKP